MDKNNHFDGQPLYGQVIKLLDKSKSVIRLRSLECAIAGICRWLM